MARVKRRIKRLLSPVTQSALRQAIEEVTGGGASTLYVHSGLSNLGYVVGAPGEVIDSLGGLCDNLFLPVHTYCYPERDGEPGAIFDRTKTPCDTGRLADAFWRRPGVVRSIHSTHSVAGQGPLAAELLDGHYECETPCGAGTPFSRLVHRGASVLMIGVSFHSYTPFHTLECEADSCVALEPPELMDRLRFVDEAGTVQERLRRRQNRFNSRFRQAGALLEEKGLVRRRNLGRDALLFAPDMSKIHEFFFDQVRAVPDYLRAECKTELS